MLLNSSLYSIKISLLDVIVVLLCAIILMFIVKSIKNTFIRYSKKYILKNIILIVSFAFSFSLIISSIIFFYKTQMTKMLIPSVMGIVLLVANTVIYILFFEDDEVR